ncbi:MULTISPECIES: hypothetical protein [unclassified Arcicella]|uniref:hypothetical protein n=1 Tax=unclassified Arcicella TaxID=2644986 RepID=UPI00285948A0|nr:MULTISPECIES: hypothetical protein [unclassified Arcicella]MDR6562841.1 hypothetical protein [Arcicella sp. BE51]MDR6812818.1 hypothetical protein [Arcicella sp. BE140]MDR6824130.1 hypothetical protein [Arcicella sp. BE139]
MKAYQQQWIEHAYLQAKAQNWFEKGLLTEQQNNDIKKQFVLDYYQPNVFIKIALFLFTALACIFSISLLYLIFENSFTQSPVASTTILSIIFGIATVILLEYLIREKKVFQSGIDNALIYFSIGAFCTFTYYLLETSHLPAWVECIFFLPFFVIAYIRYADALVACGIYFLLIIMLVDFCLEFTIGKTLLPFVMLFFSLGMNRLVMKLSQRKDYLYYETSLDILKTLSIASFYLSVNYFIVREGNAMINKVFTSVAPQIGLAPLFYFFTTVIPFVYVYIGLKKRDRTFLMLGLLTLAFSFFTYRHYFGVIPTEIALLICGGLMIGGASLAINFLKQPKYGFTYTPDNNLEGFNLDTILLAEVVNSKINTHDKPFKFGGGSSAGGGAGSEY